MSSAPEAAKNKLQEEILTAQTRAEKEFRRMEGGVGTFYEYYTARGDLLLYKLAYERSGCSNEPLTVEQKMLAREIRDNFQKRTLFLSNAVQTGAAHEAEVCYLRINALFFHREVILASDNAPRFLLLRVQEHIVREVQSLLDTLQEKKGVDTTRHALDAAERMLQREKRRLEAIRKKSCAQTGRAEGILNGATMPSPRLTPGKMRIFH